MTRKEQAEEYAMAWLATVYGKNPIDYFLAGQEWADVNPIENAWTDRMNDLEHDHKIMKSALEEMDHKMSKESPAYFELQFILSKAINQLRVK